MGKIVASAFHQYPRRLGKLGDLAPQPIKFCLLGHHDRIELVKRSLLKGKLLFERNEAIFARIIVSCCGDHQC